MAWAMPAGKPRRGGIPGFAGGFATPAAAGTGKRVDDRNPFDVWRTFADIPERTVLPRDAEDDAGVVSRTIRPRFCALLYAGVDPTVAGLLTVEVARRTAALEAFASKAASGSKRRKLEFRARMRR